MAVNWGLAQQPNAFERAFAEGQRSAMQQRAMQREEDAIERHRGAQPRFQPGHHVVEDVLVHGAGGAGGAGDGVDGLPGPAGIHRLDEAGQPGRPARRGLGEVGNCIDRVRFIAEFSRPSEPLR